jgi:hypothetical protein
MKMWKNNTYMKGALCFYSIKLLFNMNIAWNQKTSVLVSQNNSKLYMIYRVYIEYITILHLDHFFTFWPLD